MEIDPHAEGLRGSSAECSSGNWTGTNRPAGYEVTVRVAKDDGNQPDPAAFAAAASNAASSRNASVVSAHMAGEIICLVCVAAPDRPAAIAVALAVVADALRTENPVLSPSR
jgi:hypothetical protein